MRQLGYWRSGGPGALFVPELPKVRGRVVYSFRDVVALRTFVYLRDAVSLQKIRRAVGNLRDLGNTDHLSRYQLRVEGSSIVWIEPEGAVDLVEQPGAQRMIVALGAVFAPFENQRGEQVVDLFRPRKHLLVDPEVRGGYPVVEGSRVDFDIVAALVHDGVDPEDVRDFYPSVSSRGAADAADFADEVDRYRLAGRATA